MRRFSKRSHQPQATKRSFFRRVLYSETLEPRHLLAVDLLLTHFDAMPDHVLLGQTVVTVEVRNDGDASSAAFRTQIVWSANATFGDADDRIVDAAILDFASLAPGEMSSRTAQIQLDRAALFAHSLAKDPADQAPGTASQDISYLFAVADYGNQVAESEEQNNISVAESITYFPWDVDGSGSVDSWEVNSTFAAIGTSETRFDFDGSGNVDVAEASSIGSRINYVTSRTVNELGYTWGREQVIGWHEERVLLIATHLPDVHELEITSSNHSVLGPDDVNVLHRVHGDIYFSLRHRSAAYGAATIRFHYDGRIAGDITVLVLPPDDLPLSDAGAPIFERTAVEDRDGAISLVTLVNSSMVAALVKRGNLDVASAIKMVEPAPQDLQISSRGFPGHLTISQVSQASSGSQGNSQVLRSTVRVSPALLAATEAAPGPGLQYQENLKGYHKNIFQPKLDYFDANEFALEVANQAAKDYFNTGKVSLRRLVGPALEGVDWTRIYADVAGVAVGSVSEDHGQLLADSAHLVIDVADVAGNLVSTATSAVAIAGIGLGITYKAELGLPPTPIEIAWITWNSARLANSVTAISEPIFAIPQRFANIYHNPVVAKFMALPLSERAERLSEFSLALAGLVNPVMTPYTIKALLNFLDHRNANLESQLAVISTRVVATVNGETISSFVSELDNDSLTLSINPQLTSFNSYADEYEKFRNDPKFLETGEPVLSPETGSTPPPPADSSSKGENGVDLQTIVRGAFSLVSAAQSASSITSTVTQIFGSSAGASGDYIDHDGSSQNLYVNQTRFGTGVKDNITTGEGNDLVFTYGDKDTITTSKGIDRIDAGHGSNTVSAGSGDDRITTGNDSDIIMAGLGADSIRPGGGNDLIEGGFGHDRIIYGDPNNPGVRTYDDRDIGNDILIDPTKSGEIQFLNHAFDELQFRKDGAALEIILPSTRTYHNNTLRFQDFFVGDAAGWELLDKFRTRYSLYDITGRIDSFRALQIAYAPRAESNIPVYPDGITHLSTISPIGSRFTLHIAADNRLSTSRGIVIYAEGNDSITNWITRNEMGSLREANLLLDEFVRAGYSFEGYETVNLVGRGEGGLIAQWLAAAAATRGPSFVNASLINTPDISGLVSQVVRDEFPEYSEGFPTIANTYLVSPNDWISRIGIWAGNDELHANWRAFSFTFDPNAETPILPEFADIQRAHRPTSAEIDFAKLTTQGMDLATIRGHVALRSAQDLTALYANRIIEIDGQQHISTTNAHEVLLDQNSGQGDVISLARRQRDTFLLQLVRSDDADLDYRLNIDFGPEGSHYDASTHQLATDNVLYVPNATAVDNFGWEILSGLNAQDRGHASNLERDFVEVKDNTFIVDVPKPGRYIVGVTYGDRDMMRESMQLFVNGYPVDRLSTMPGDNLTRYYLVNSLDPQIRLRFVDRGGNLADASNSVAVNGLNIEHVDYRATLPANEQLEDDRSLIVMAGSYELPETNGFIETLEDSLKAAAMALAAAALPALGAALIGKATFASAFATNLGISTGTQLTASLIAKHAALAAGKAIGKELITSIPKNFVSDPTARGILTSAGSIFKTIDDPFDNKSVGETWKNMNKLERFANGLSILDSSLTATNAVVQRALGNDGEPLAPEWMYQVGASLAQQSQKFRLGQFDTGFIPVKVDEVIQAIADGKTNEQLLRRWGGSRDILALDWLPEGVELTDVSVGDHRSFVNRGARALKNLLEAHIDQLKQHGEQTQLDVLFIAHGAAYDLSREVLERLNKSDIRDALDYVKLVTLDPISFNETSGAFSHPELNPVLDSIHNLYQTENTPAGSLFHVGGPLDYREGGGTEGMLNRTARIFDLVINQEILRTRDWNTNTLELSAAELTDIEFNLSESLFATSAMDGTVSVRYVHDVRDEDTHQVLYAAGTTKFTVWGNEARVRSVAFVELPDSSQPNGRKEYLLTISSPKNASDDEPDRNKILLTDVATGEPVWQGFDAGGTQIEASPSGNVLVSADRNGRVKVWVRDAQRQTAFDEVAGKQLHPKNDGSYIADLTVINDRFFVTAGLDGSLKLAEFVEGQINELHKIPFPNPVRNLDYDPYNGILAVASGRELSLWHVDQAKKQLIRIATQLDTFDSAQHAGAIQGVAFSKPGFLIDEEGKYIGDYHLPRTDLGDIDRIALAAFLSENSLGNSRTGLKLATGGEDKTIILYGLDQIHIGFLKELQVISGDMLPVRELALSSNGIRLAVVGEDNTDGDYGGPVKDTNTTGDLDDRLGWKFSEAFLQGRREHNAVPLEYIYEHIEVDGESYFWLRNRSNANRPAAPSSSARYDLPPNRRGGSGDVDVLPIDIYIRPGKELKINPLHYLIDAYRKDFSINQASLTTGNVVTESGVVIGSLAIPSQNNPNELRFSASDNLDFNAASRFIAKVAFTINGPLDLEGNPRTTTATITFNVINSPPRTNFDVLFAYPDRTNEITPLANDFDFDNDEFNLAPFQSRSIQYQLSSGGSVAVGTVNRVPGTNKLRVVTTLSESDFAIVYADFITAWRANNPGLSAEPRYVPFDIAYAVVETRYQATAAGRVELRVRLQEAPGGVRHFDVGADQLWIGWDPVGWGVENYIIEQNTGTANQPLWIAIKTVPGTETKTRIRNLAHAQSVEPNKTYELRVRASNPSRNLSSDAHSVKTPDYEPTRSLTIAPPTSSTITLTWEAVLWQAAVYRVELRALRLNDDGSFKRKDDGSFDFDPANSWSKDVNASGDKSYTFKGLQPGTSFLPVVTALNASATIAREQLASSPVTTLFKDFVSGISAERIGPEKIKFSFANVSWNPVAYLVTAVPTADRDALPKRKFVRPDNGNLTTAVLEGLTENTEYVVWVQAQTKSGLWITIYPVADQPNPRIELDNTVFEAGTSQVVLTESGNSPGLLLPEDFSTTLRLPSVEGVPFAATFTVLSFAHNPVVVAAFAGETVELNDSALPAQTLHPALGPNLVPENAGILVYEFQRILNGWRILVSNSASQARVQSTTPRLAADLIFEDDQWISSFRELAVFPKRAEIALNAPFWNADVMQLRLHKAVLADGIPVQNADGTYRLAEEVVNQRSNINLNRTSQSSFKREFSGLEEEFYYVVVLKTRGDGHESTQHLLIQTTKQQAPLGVEVIDADLRSATIKWTAVDWKATHHRLITTEIDPVTGNSIGQAFEPIVVRANEKTSITVTGLKRGANYRFTVESRNANGDWVGRDDGASTKNFRMPDFVLPELSFVRQTGVANRSIALDWSEVFEDGSFAADGVRIKYKLASSGSTEQMTSWLGGKVADFELSELKRAAAYEIVVEFRAIGMSETLSLPLATFSTRPVVEPTAWVPEGGIGNREFRIGIGHNDPNGGVKHLTVELSLDGGATVRQTKNSAGVSGSELEPNRTQFTVARFSNLSGGFEPILEASNYWVRVVAHYHGAGRAESTWIPIATRFMSIRVEDLRPDQAGDGSRGFVISGASNGDLLGSTISIIGDVNSDGFDDFAISATQDDRLGTNSGSVYVIFGRADGSEYSSRIDLSQPLHPEDGFTILGSRSGDLAGTAISSIGDFNGDSVDDFAISVPESDWNQTKNNGVVYVVYGKPNGVRFPATLVLNQISRADGFKLVGGTAGTKIGSSLAQAGDVDNDGLADLLIGAAEASPNGKKEAGSAFLVYGQSPVNSFLVLGANSTSEFIRYDGLNAGDKLGVSVAGLGDVNRAVGQSATVHADFAIGAPRREADRGAVYVIYGGSRTHQVANSNLQQVNSATGLTLRGESPGDLFGRSIAGIGDFNNDGFEDIIVGAPWRTNRKGVGYVLLGSSGGLAGGAALDQLVGSNGFKINGGNADERIGSAAARVGDVNLDGFDDIFIGASNRDRLGASDAGAAYLILGGPQTNATIDVRESAEVFSILGDKANGRLGTTVGGSADLNGDGFPDLLVGAPFQVQERGAGFVVYGDDFTRKLSTAPTSGADQFTGDAGKNSFVGGAGNDVLLGNGGEDLLYAGPGDDVLQIGDTRFVRVDGGTGNDTLRLAGQNISLDLDATSGRRLFGIEEIDLLTATQATITVSPESVLRLSDTKTLIITQGPDDVVSFVGAWTRDGQVMIDDMSYERFRSGRSTLLVNPISNQPPSIVFKHNERLEVSEDGSTIDIYTFWASPPPIGEVRIYAGAREYGRIEFKFGQVWEPLTVTRLGTSEQNPGVIAVRGLDNSNVEGDIFVNIWHQILSSNDPRYPANGTFSVPDVQVKVLEDEAQVAVSASSAGVDEDSGEPIVITFDRTAALHTQIEVFFDIDGSAAFGSDYIQTRATSFTLTGGSIVFAPGETQKQIILTPLADSNFELNQDIQLTLVDGLHSSPRYRLVGPAAVHALIHNDDDDPAGAPPRTGNIPVAQISPELETGGRVFDLRQSPDGEFVAYVADLNGSGIDQLYLVPTDGGETIQVTNFSNANIFDFEFTPDSSRVLFRAQVESRVDLFAANISSGTALKLTAGLTHSTYFFKVNPASTHVVLVSGVYETVTYNLYSVAITGGQPTKLNGPLVAGGSVSFSAADSSPQLHPFDFADGGNRIVYIADELVDRQTDLFSVRLDGSERVRLNNNPGGDDIEEWDYRVSPDGSFVAFTYEIVNFPPEVHVVPVAGGQVRVIAQGELDAVSNDLIVYKRRINNRFYPFVTRLSTLQTYQLWNGIPNFGGVASNWIVPSLISADEQSVIFSEGSETENQNVGALYSVRLSNGAVTKLTQGNVLGADNTDPVVADVRGNTLLYYTVDVFREPQSTSYTIYSVDLNSGLSTPLTRLPADGSFNHTFGFGRSLKISANGSHAVFLANSRGPWELFSVPIAGGDVVVLTPYLPENGHVQWNVPVNYPIFHQNDGWFVSHQSNQVFYIADQDADNKFELFSVPYDVSGDLYSFDFGDAPSSYNTLLANNGARHRAIGPTLGEARDSEATAAPGIGANSDDQNGLDDEDGVFIDGPLIASSGAARFSSISIYLQSPDTNGNYLDAWIDWNRDGTFESSERIFNAYALGLVAGWRSVDFEIPQAFEGTVSAGVSYARFRLSTAGGLAPFGEGLDGEVEDYAVEIQIDKDIPAVEYFRRADGHGVWSNSQAVVYEVKFTEDVTNVGPDDFRSITQVGARISEVSRIAPDLYKVSVTQLSSGNLEIGLAENREIFDVVGNRVGTDPAWQSDEYLLDFDAFITVLPSPLSDGWLNLNESPGLTLAGQSDKEATIALLFTDRLNQQLSVTVVADIDGHWNTGSIDLRPLADGEIRLVASATDFAANRATSEIVFVKDTSLPVVKIDDQFRADKVFDEFEVGSVIVFGMSSNDVANLTFRASDAGSPSSGLTMRLTPANGAWSTPSLDIRQLTDGLVTLEAYANDSAGNMAISRADFTKDAKPKDATILPASRLALPGERVRVPITINVDGLAKDVSEAEFEVTFDPSLLTITSNFVLQAVDDADPRSQEWSTAAGWTMSRQVFQDRVILSFALPAGQASQSGENLVATLDFLVNESVQFGSSTQIHATSLNSNLGSNSWSSRSATIEFSTLQVNDFHPTSTGFVVQLNQSPNLDLINAFKLGDATDLAADIRFFGASSGSVHGSYSFNAQTNTLTFVATDGTLAADEYTLVLASDERGWNYAFGGRLDGDADGIAGGDYVKSFHIAESSTHELLIPSFVRGPGQPVNVPANELGLPVTLSFGAAITSFEFVLNYDPNSLGISRVHTGSSLPNDWSVESEYLAGRLLVRGIGATPLNGADLELVRLEATVAESASYGSSSVVSLSDARFNEGSFAITETAAMAVHAYLGDLSGDEQYTGYDAGLILERHYDRAFGLVAYPLVDPVLIGDATNDGLLSSLDSKFVAEKSVDLPRPEIPDIPTTAAMSIGNALDATLSIASGIYGAAPGETRSVFVDIDDAVGLLGGNLEIDYNPLILSLANEGLSIPNGAGGFLEGWVFAANADATNGVLKLAIYNRNSHAGTGGRIAELKFTVAEEAASAVYALKVQAQLNSDSSANHTDGDFTVERPASIASIVIGEGTQRSQVRQVQIEFDQLVNVADGGITVWRRSQGSAPAVQVGTFIETLTVSGRTIANLTFHGSQTHSPSNVGGSLLDGNYEIRINGAMISNRFETLLDANGDQLAGGLTTFGDSVDESFYRLYADTDGDRFVGVAEFGQFRSTFGKRSIDAAFNELFDFEGDHEIGIADFGQFRTRFGKKLDFE